MHEVCCTVARTHIVHIYMYSDKTGETTKRIMCACMYINMRAHVRHFFFQRIDIYRWTIVRARCGVHPEHECNPRALPLKEVDTRNPISPNDIAIARDNYLKITPLFTLPYP